MNGRDKIMLAGLGALLLGLGAAATLFDSEEPDKPKAIEPVAREFVDPSPPIPSGTRRLLEKALPVEEIPQEFKEAENYLESRWGHLGDAGLMAPGIMGDGDQFFMDRKVISGVRGNGKPIFARAFIRPEKFTGPGVKSGHTQGVEMPFKATSPELDPARTQANVSKFKNKGPALTDKTKGKTKGKLNTMENQPGSGYSPRGGGGSGGGGGTGGGGGGRSGGGSQ